MNSRKPVLKTLSVITALFLLLSVTSKTAYAAEGESWVCGLGGIGQAYCTYKLIQESFKPVNTRRTIADTATAALIDVPSQVVFGRNLDQLQLCMAKIGGYVDQINVPAELEEPTDDCSDLKVATAVTGKMGYPTQYRSYGSLMGMGAALNDVVNNTPVPVSLAYYGRHMAAKIPLLNQTALAAETDSSGIFGLEVVLTVWEQIRNISYGVLAVFMLAIGIMVMLRQKINPQTVVTVQSAIPRIIIAVILITFSYPIAALAIRLIGPLSALVVNILNLGGSYQEFLTALPPTTLFLLPLSVVFAFMGGPGVLGVLAFIVMALVLVFFLIKVLVLILMSHLKIVFSVLTAPLVFAWGAIPGNEDATPDWLKQLAVNIISVPAMTFGLGLAFFVALEMTSTVLNNPGIVPFGAGGSLGPAVNVGGGLFVWFGVPLILTVILLQTGKIPQTLEETVLGRKPRGKK